MTDSDNLLDSIIDEETRRSFVKKGALATTGTGLVASSNSATAQVEEDDEDDTIAQEEFKVALFQNDFRGGAKFIITSEVIEFSPNIPQNLGGPLTGFNTYFATYLNTAERFPLFIAGDAQLEANLSDQFGYFVDPDQEFAEDELVQPQVYRLENVFSRYEDTDRIVTAFASPLEEDAENAIFAAEGLNTQEELNNFLF